MKTIHIAAAAVMAAASVLSVSAQTFTVYPKNGVPVTYAPSDIDHIQFFEGQPDPIVVEPKVGDIFYSDGTWSTKLDKSKEAVGVIFWLGDPTAQDAALKRDYPECTHGLVIAAKPNMNAYAWQIGVDSSSPTVGEWITANTDYKSVSSQYGYDTRRNLIAGYNNTKALEAYNNSEYGQISPVMSVVRALAFRNENPAPEGTSGWYLPSVKEMTLVLNEEIDGEVLLYNNSEKDKCMKNAPVIEAALRLIPDSEPLSRATWSFDYWTSNEWTADQAYMVSSDSGTAMCTDKTNTHNQVVRCILAF